MERLLIILPHCSTGGMPQYTSKFIDTYKHDMNIHVCEVNFLSDQYTVQRKHIQNQVAFHPLYGDQSKLPSLIQEVKPDIIHFQEVPEHFIDPVILSELFRSDRAYFIVATTHSSRTDPNSVRYVPDRWVLVNEWSRRKFAERFGEENCLVWEYPIRGTLAIPSEKLRIRKSLGIYSERKMILNVGLFTPGKNQGELFEIAHNNPLNQYHFVGNQAENFRPYWEPLMRDKPKNCYVWGERSDVRLFYIAADEFYFTSLEELNPICIKEALGHGLPVKMKKLPSYLDQYDDHPLVTYIP
jgi:hypothetical protein